MERILVAGCCGFIGHKVSELLLLQGYTVIGIDDMNNYYDPRLKQLRLNLLLGQKKDFIFYRCDINDYKELRNIFSKHAFLAVINLAARAGVRASIDNPWLYIDTNVKGTLNLLECCREFNIKKFIFASSSSVYGNNKKLPFTVEDDTDSPLVPYSVTKKAGEVLCYSYHYLYNIDITIPRFFTVYGPWGRPDMSVYKFIKNIDNGVPIVIFGDGSQKRDFTYIDDIAFGTLRCLKNVQYRIFNFGNDNPIEVKYLIEIIENALQKKAITHFLPPYPGEIKDTWADITLTKKILDWQPTTKIEEGIEKTVKWYFDNKEFINSLNN